MTLTIDDREVTVAAGTTILRGLPRQGTEIPTLCYGDTITPKNACRVCMVEVEGSRCSCRRARGGSRTAWSCARDTERAPPQPAAGARAARVVGRPVADGERRPVERRVRRRPRSTGPTPRQSQPVKVDNPLYVRDYAKCILCYQCVDACGEQWQQTWAIGVAGRGFERDDLHRVRRRAARLGVRLLRQLHPGLPDGRADVHVRARDARRRHVGRGRARRRPTRSAPTAGSAAR